MESVELSRGMFRRADAPPASYPDRLAMPYRAPRTVVCCVSAAAVHDLTDQLPVAVQSAMLTRERSPRIAHPPTQAFCFATDTFEVGLTAVKAPPGELVRIYDPARTIVDLMRVRHRLGEPLAHPALHRYLRCPDARPGELLRLADTLGAQGPAQRALDVATAG